MGGRADKADNREESMAIRRNDMPFWISLSLSPPQSVIAGVSTAVTHPVTQDACVTVTLHLFPKKSS